MKKRIIIVLAIVLFLGLIIAGIGFYLTRAASYTGTIQADVDSSISIIRDRTGIPLIKAKTYENAFFTVGFLHAQDRLPIIEYYRSASTGKLSELIGEKGILIDKIALAIDFNRYAKEIIKNISPEHRKYIKCYVKGINLFKNKYQYINSILYFPVEEWVESDVISILLLFEWTNAFLNNKELLFPLPRPSNSNQRTLSDLIPKDLLYYYSINNKQNIDVLKNIKSALENSIGFFQRGIAFYISGRNTIDSRAATGYILDNNMQSYPKWYPLSLEVGNLIINGITSPGLPFIFFGNNRNISFLGFNLDVDTQDFYIEKTIKRKGEERYYSNGKWKKFKKASKIIKITKNSKDGYQISFNLRRTDHGPVISDFFKDIYKTDVISLKSIIPDADYVSSLFKIPFSESKLNARKSVKDIYSTPKIYLFSSNKNSTISYSGKLPLRNISKNIFKRSYNKVQNMLDLSKFYYISSYRNIVIGCQDFERASGILKGYFLSRKDIRGQRLKRIIDNQDHIEIKDIKNILKDTYSTVAENYIPLFISFLENIPITSARMTKIYFQDWDKYMKAQSVPASIFQSLLIIMIKETISDELGDSSDDALNNYSFLVDNYYKILKTGRSLLFDDIKTIEKIEIRDTIFDRAFLKTMRFLNKQRGPIMDNWKWSSLHKGHYRLSEIVMPWFLEKVMIGSKDRGIEGGNSTVWNSPVSALEMLKCNSCSCLSGIFVDTMSNISLSFGMSVNPLSEFYGNYNINNKYIRLDNTDKYLSMKIIPHK